MFSIDSSKMIFWLIASNLIWFIFTAYIIYDHLSVIKKANRMIDRLAESNEYIDGEFKDLRDEYMKLKRKYDEQSIAVFQAVNKAEKALKEGNLQ